MKIIIPGYCIKSTTDLKEKALEGTAGVPAATQGVKVPAPWLISLIFTQPQLNPLPPSPSFPPAADTVKAHSWNGQISARSTTFHTEESSPTTVPVNSDNDFKEAEESLMSTAGIERGGDRSIEPPPVVVTVLSFSGSCCSGSMFTVDPLRSLRWLEYMNNTKEYMNIIAVLITDILYYYLCNLSSFVFVFLILHKIV